MNRSLLAAAASALLFAVGCAESPSSGQGPLGGQGGTDAADGSDGSGSTDGTDEAATTYYRDVEPVLQQHCVRCHQDGGLGPGDYEDPDTVVALAPALLGAMDAGRMPPPASDPDCMDYLGSEHLTLPQDARDVVASWIDEGTPLGDPADAPEPVVIETELSDPDVVLRMPEPYAPTFEDPENPGNEYRCFVIDPGEASGKFITALAPQLGAPELVHHIVLFRVDPDDLREGDRDPQGYDCIDRMGGSTIGGMVAAWAPGMLPLELPEGTGIEVSENSLLVMQMHYFANGGAPGEVFDQSAYAFRTADSARPALVAPVGSFGFTIPPGESEHTHTDGFSNDFLPGNMIATFPHMHQLGSAYNLRLEKADGSEICLARGEYDFNNQLTYQWREPVALDVGDTLRWSCTWDNSEGESAVGFGERTDEEMCFFFTIMSF